MNFTDETTKPATKAMTKDNKFLSVIKEIAGTERIKSYVLDGKTLKENQEQLAKDTRLMKYAGSEPVLKENQVTVHVRDEVLNDGTSIKVVFWTGKKIRQNRKPKTAAPVTVAPAKAAPKPAAK